MRVVVWRDDQSRIEFEPDGSWWPYIAYHSTTIFNTGMYHYQWWAIFRTKMKHRRINKQLALYERHK